MFISTILSVIILLSIIGYMMYKSKTKQIYPATINDCPDFYDLNDDNKCIANTFVWNDFTPGSDCNTIDFKSGSYMNLITNVDVSYNAPGNKKNSGKCAKKLKSQECEITWDGITNTKTIC